MILYVASVGSLLSCFYYFAEKLKIIGKSLLSPSSPLRQTCVRCNWTTGSYALAIAGEEEDGKTPSKGKGRKSKDTK